ncbi:MAG: hypothetical protein KDA84_04810, partial [Planctomycetaceae bacterium]|nr:hypothetical protein [Planctomycetaceae bacterium]
HLQNEELNRHVTALKGFMQDWQLDEAELYVKKLAETNPQVHGHPDFQAEVRNLEQLIRQDEDRRNQLEYKLAVARNTWDELSPDDPASLEPNRINMGFDALDEAKTIAKTAMERRAILEWEEKLNQKKRAVQLAVDDKFQMEVSQFQRSVNALDPDALDYSSQLQSYRTNAEFLKERKWVSRDLPTRLIDPILAEIDFRIHKDEIARKEARSLEEIRKSVGEPVSFQNKLNEYINNAEFENSPRRRDFQHLLENETELWVGAEEWNKVTSKFKGANLVSYNPKYAPMRIEEANALLEKHKGLPGEPKLKEVVDYLNLIVIRNEGGSLGGLMKNVLKPDIVSNLYILETKAVGQEVGKRYYCREIPVAKGGTHHLLRYALDPEFEVEKTVLVTNKDIANPSIEGEGGFDFESPQMKFSRFAKEKVGGLLSDPTTWERDFLEVLAALHKDQTMDQVLKFNLYFAIEDVACKGSLYLRDQLKEDLETWTNFGNEVDTSWNWLNPDNGTGDAVHKAAANVLGKLKDPNVALKGLDTYLKTLEKVDLGPQSQWIGWLHRDRKNQWTVSLGTNQPLNESVGKLWVLTRAGGNESVNFTEIGELKNGRVTINVPDDSPVLLQGRPVYKFQ